MRRHENLPKSTSIRTILPQSKIPLPKSGPRPRKHVNRPSQHNPHLQNNPKKQKILQTLHRLKRPKRRPKIQTNPYSHKKKPKFHFPQILQQQSFRSGHEFPPRFLLVFPYNNQPKHLQQTSPSQKQNEPPYLQRP